MKVHVCGIDIGKTVFHLVGLSKEGHIVTRSVSAGSSWSPLRCTCRTV